MLNGISIYHGVCHPPHGSASRAAETRCTSQAAPVINSSSASPSRCSLGTSWLVRRGESQLRCHLHPRPGTQRPSLGAARAHLPPLCQGRRQPAGRTWVRWGCHPMGCLEREVCPLSQPCLSRVSPHPDPLLLRCPGTRQSHNSWGDGAQ